jgi:aminoglycoside phosphotransferase (APT) family kinase protein
VDAGPVTATDPRVRPLVALGRREVAAMLAPLLAGDEPGEVARVGGGLINTVYRVAPARGGAAYALRVYAHPAAFELEHRLLPRLTTLPVPAVLLADASGEHCPHPYLVYRWLDGVVLNACRRHAAPEAFGTVAEPLGRLLARLARVTFPGDLAGEEPAAPGRPARIADRLARARERLRGGPARARLGDALADRLGDRLTRGAPRLEALGAALGEGGLAHGDLGGRNVIVRDGGGGRWEAAGVIDWEMASAGSPLWDLGSLFRYAERYPPAFRERFARGYRAEGGALPDDWWETARLLDATRLVAILSEARELPAVFAECRALVEAVAASGAGST